MTLTLLRFDEWALQNFETYRKGKQWIRIIGGVLYFEMIYNEKNIYIVAYHTLFKNINNSRLRVFFKLFNL